MQINNFLKVIIVILLGTLGGTIAWLFVFKNQSAFVQLVNKEERVYIEENTALTSAIKNVKDSVVNLKTEYNKKEIQGFGLVLTVDGLIITLAENVPQGSKVNITINGGSSISYQVLKRDLNENLALIKLDKNNLQAKGFFDLSKLEIGTRVFILSNSVNEGIVKTFDENLIKTNIIENEKINGAPVFDIKGEVLGIGYRDINDFINIIPVSKIKSFSGL
ncbi:MAG TPA: S1C family serine protease [Candidatus Pacearchaeota archaeon]|nr:S1C family serine protease [Candidatus Pacearchaeota archaeon]HPR79639.1 S1C family serine protease [Candidatus Pacearchaeota archaeon]